MFTKFLKYKLNIKNLKFLNYKFNYNKIKNKNIKDLNIFYKNVALLYNSYLSYLFVYKNNYILINKNNVKYNNLISKINLKNNLITYNVRKGIQEKDLIIFFKSFNKIYDLFYNNKDLLINLNYKYSKEFLYNFFKYSNYNNIMFILNWIYNWTKPIFFMECSLVPKKYVKKLKKKYIYKIKYLSPKYRVNKSLRWIKNYMNSLKYNNANNRFLFCYLDLILNYKFSYIYLKKVEVYKKIFKV